MSTSGRSRSCTGARPRTPTNVEAVARRAKFVYLADGSPLHLRSVLKGSALYDAMLAAYRSGAVIAASGAGATVLCDPMVDPRGGAYTVGLGVVEGLAVFPYHGTAADHLRERSIDLLPPDAILVGIDEETALAPRARAEVVGRRCRRRHDLRRRRLDAATRPAPRASTCRSSASGARRSAPRWSSAVVVVCRRLGDRDLVDRDLLGRASPSPSTWARSDSIFWATSRPLVTVPNRA